MGKLIGICAAIVCIAGSAFCDQAAEAKAAVEGYLTTFKRGKPAEIFQLLPKSYQKDVNDIVSLFGQKMDAEVWKASTALLGEATQTARAQKKLLAQMITEGDDGKKKPTPQDLQKAEGTILIAADALDGLSEISIPALKKGDTIGLLKNPKIAKLSISALPDDFDITKYKVTGAKQTEQGVVVTISGGRDDHEDIPMVLVDSVWVPADMAKEWKEMISSSKKEIAEFKIDPEMKKKIMTVIPMLKMGLSQVKLAKTKEQLQIASMGLMMPIMMTFADEKEEDGKDDVKQVAPTAPKKK